MDSHQIRSFIRVAECHSMSKAADEFFLSPSALKQQMDSLETEIGVKLFHRSPKGVTLTPSGEYFLEKCRGLIDEVGEILQETRKISSGSSSTVSVGFRHMKITDYLYPEFLKWFLGEHSGTEVTLVDLNQNSYDNVDVLLCDYVGSREFELACHLQDVPVQCVMNRLHPLARREALTVEDLKSQEVIIPPLPILKNLQPELAGRLMALKISYQESTLSREVVYLNLQTCSSVFLTFGEEKYLNSALVQIPLPGYQTNYSIYTRKKIQKSIVQEFVDGMAEFYAERSPQ